MPQRHQAERNKLKYALRFLTDTVWPPTRVLKILRAWHEAPGRADALLRKHRPGARFAVFGHTHRPGVWSLPSGARLINTGAYYRPLGSLAVDLRPGSLVVRRVNLRGGEFRLGAPVAEFSLNP